MKRLVYRMMVYMSKRMIACDEAAYLISYRQEKRLGFPRWWRLNMHLLSCHLCRKYARQIGQLSRVMDDYRDHSSHESCEHHLEPEAGARIYEVLSKKLNVK